MKKKSLFKNYYRNKNQMNKNNDNDIQFMKNTFEDISSIFLEIQNSLISPNISLIQIKQCYKRFLDEINKLKEIIQIIMNKKSQNPEITNNHSTNNNIKDKEIKCSPNIKIFQSIDKELYQTYAIKLNTIKIKNTKIRENIKNYSLKLEDDEKNIAKRNKYLEGVANLSIFAHEYSYKLLDILLQQFNKNNKFKTIIYEKAKEEFSSWVNQSLQIESSQKIYFFENLCSKEFQYSPIYRSIKDNKDKILLEHYSRLFIDLCELFTESLLFSERDIELKYFEKGIIYQQDAMNDITELKGIRYVYFTVLPGLSVNEKCFPFAKTIVFCGYESNPKLQFNIKLPKKNDIILNRTIKTNNIKDKLKINFSLWRDGEYIVFQIETDPEIPNDDNPYFSLHYGNGTSWNCLCAQSNKKIFYLKKENIPKNAYIAVSVKINGEIKCSNVVCTTNNILNSK